MNYTDFLNGKVAIANGNRSMADFAVKQKMPYEFKKNYARIIVGYIFYGSDASFFIQRDGLLGIGLNNASDWLEVIGSIHDNPKSMEDKS